MFLFRYGKKIYDKLNDAMNPPAGEERMNPFDFWKGADFRLKLRTVEGYRNYDMSSFSSPSPLHADDSVIEKIWNKEHPLQPFIDEKSFKSYDELKAKLDRVLGTPKLRVVEEDKPTNVVSFKEDDNSGTEEEEETTADFKQRMKLFQEQIEND